MEELQTYSNMIKYYNLLNKYKYYIKYYGDIF